MNTPKRYDHDKSGAFPHTTGRFVLFSDYEALEKERDVWKRRAKEKEKPTFALGREIETARAENQRLSARLAEAEKDKGRGFDTLRKILRERTKGETETWGFVALFMEMIDEAEKSAAAQTKEG